MRIGEIWNDKEDGSKVKIVDLEYIESKRQDLLTVEVLDDIVGFQIERNEFLNEYEKTTLVKA